MNTLQLTCIEISPNDGWGIILFGINSNDPTIYASSTFSVQVTDCTKFEVNGVYDLNLQRIN